MNEIKTGLLELSKLEQASSMLSHGIFNSDHEAYAVLKEELEEMNEAAERAIELFGLVWGNVKNDCLAPDDLKALHTNLLHMGAEMVQCLAMTSKWIACYEAPRIDEAGD